MSKTRPRPTFLLFLWLTLATIFGHALLPAGSPFARTTGSAFSVSTIDVSIAPKRRALMGPGKKSRDSSPAATDFADGGPALVPAKEAVAAPVAVATAAVPALSPFPAVAGLAGRRAHPPRAPPLA